MEKHSDSPIPGYRYRLTLSDGTYETFQFNFEEGHIPSRTSSLGGTQSMYIFSGQTHEGETVTHLCRRYKDSPEQFWYTSSGNPYMYVTPSGRKVFLSKYPVQVYRHEGGEESVIVEDQSGVGTVEYRETLGVIDAVDAKHSLFKIHVPTDAVDAPVMWKYEIHCYKQGDYTDNEPHTDSIPYLVYRFENPSDDKLKDFSKLKVSKLSENGDVLEVHNFSYNNNDESWTLTKGEGTYKEKMTVTISGDKLKKVKSFVVRNINEEITSQRKEIQYLIEGEYKTVSVSYGGEGNEVQSHTTYYCSTSIYNEFEQSDHSTAYLKMVNTNNLNGLIHMERSVSGRKSVFIYDDHSNINLDEISIDPEGEFSIPSYSNSLNTAMPKLVRKYEQSRTEYIQTDYCYDTHPGDSREGRFTGVARTETKTEKGIVTSKIFYVYGKNLKIVERASAVDKNYGDSGNLRTTTTYYDEASGFLLHGREKCITYPDGRTETYAYQNGVYDSLTRTFTEDAGGTYLRTTITYGTVDSPQGIAGKTQQLVRINDITSNELYNAVNVYNGSDYELISWEAMEYKHQKMTDKLTSKGLTESAQWSCCNKQSEIKQDGSEYIYTPNLLNQRETVTRKGFNGTDDQITSYTYTPEGDVLTITRKSSAADSIPQITTFEYNTMGLKTFQKDAEGNTVTYNYNFPERKVTETYHDDSTKITLKNIDGSIKSITGTAVVDKFYRYGVNNDGSKWMWLNLATATSPRWVRTTTDILGRIVKVEKSSAVDGEINETVYTYDAKGRKFSVKQSGSVAVLYQYDEVGKVCAEVLDVNDNGVIDTGVDRIVELDQQFVKESNTWYLQRATGIYRDAMNIATEVNKEKVQLSNLTNGLIAKSFITDIHDNTTVSTTNYDANTRTLVKTVDVPQSDSDSVTTIVDGLKVFESNTAGKTFSYQYDDMRRIKKEINPMLGETELTYDKLNRVTLSELSVKEGETLKKVSSSQIGYDSKGKVDSEILTDYDATGTATVRTTSHDYNQLSQRTFTTDPNNNVTGFKYNQYGQLEEVEDAENKLTRYYYNNAGLLDEQLQQLDESDNWVSTQYRYDVVGRLTKEIDDQNNETITAYNSLGEVESVTNPDNSSHSMTYNRLGLLKTLTDENNTVTTYNYTDQLLEDFRTISKGAGVEGVDYVDFSYDNFGRLQFAENRQGGENGTLITKVENVYNAKSLLEAEKQQIGSNPARTVGFGYDNNLNTSQITYPNNMNTPRVVDYNYDAMNRLKTVVKGNTTYADSSYLGFRTDTTTLGNGLTRSFSYGNAGEVLGIFDKKADNSTLLSFEYGYDKVYNRLYEKRAHSVNSTGDAYGYDKLNRLVKARYNVANSDAYDWQTDSAVDKHDINLDTVHNKTTELRGAEVTTYQSNSLHQYTSVTSAQSVVNPSYDNAGNTTLYKDFNLSYDYRNRLVKAENSQKRITFTYDVFGRRVQKTLFDKSGENWVESTKTQFVYSGDEVIEEYDYSLSTTNYELAKSYILGESIDQPIALIVEPNATHVTRSTYYYSANAQQSIMALTDENGAIAESYSYDAHGTQTVYDAFGQKISNPNSEIGNQYGYTGRRIDVETGLIYFRARYYSPELGRFISRDPLAFVDGMNLYAGYFAMHGSIDPMGLQQCGLHPTRPIDTMSGKELDFDEGLANRNQQARDGQQQNRDAFVDATLGTAGLIAESTIPGVGEVMDAAVLADPNAGWGAKTVAGISLGLNYFTAGILPNAGPFLRRAGNAADAIGDTARKTDRLTDGARGVIYKVPGNKTPSGKPYVGSANDLSKRAKNARDGRNRVGAEVVDSYPIGDRNARRVAEQNAINANGGVKNLDNKRNEIAQKKWKKCGVKE